MTAEDKKALHAGPQLPYTIIAGDMNAALYQQDVQRAKFDIQDTSYQEFIRDLHLHTTDPDKYPNREYTLCHRADSSHDSRIDDMLISEPICTEMASSTQVLNT